MALPDPGIDMGHRYCSMYTQREPCGLYYKHYNLCCSKLFHHLLIILAILEVSSTLLDVFIVKATGEINYQHDFNT
jgi:hypothetical protein